MAGAPGQSVVFAGSNSLRPMPSDCDAAAPDQKRKTRDITKL